MRFCIFKAARRKNFGFWICAGMICASLVLSGAQSASAARKKTPAPNRYASIIVDMTTDTILSEKNADQKLYPASLTKMMTLYLTFEALEQGTLRKNQRLPVSRHASRQEPSSLGLSPGDTIRVEDAILALVTKSANDVAVVLGETLGGNEDRFARIMTEKAKQLGMYNTNFKNASGLHNPAQVSTARDMAALSMALIRDYPREYGYFKTKNFNFAGKTYANHNKLMSVYKGMDGLKTGYVHKSGFNLAASAVRDGHRLVGVVFGGQTSNSRNAHMAALLDRGFARVRQGGLRIASNNTMKLPVAPASSGTSLALPQKKPQFDAMGLVMRGSAGESDYAVEEGDASDIAPSAGVTSKVESWLIQVGAFSSQEAGMQALRTAKNKLPVRLTTQTNSVIAPLNTSRGTIYRARLSGFDKASASSACRVLRGNCLILAEQ